jgi:hypothetical protein
MVKRLPAIALALLLIGLLLAPAKTGEFVKSSVTAGWDAVATAAASFSDR